jgi:hypothetical protein
MASHDVTKVKTHAYRFSGYKMNRDLDHNIIGGNDIKPQPGYYSTRALSLPDNIHPIGGELGRPIESNQFHENQGK